MSKNPKTKTEESQQPLTAEEKRRMRRRRNRRRALIRMLVLALVCTLAALVLFNWDALSPDRLFTSAENLLGVGTGEYPVDLSGTGVQRLTQANEYTVVLTDSHLLYLNHTGAEVNRYALSYPTALVRTGGKYVLIAEQGGRRLHLSTRNKVVLEMEADQDIITVDVNEKGEIAVVTDGPQGYAVQMKLYNAAGRLLYTRNRNQTVTDVSLSADGTRAAMLSLEAVNGSLNTTLDVFALDTSDAESLCSYTAKDTLLYRAEHLSGGWVVAFSDHGAVMLDPSDGLATVYTPDGMRLLGFATTETNLALVLRPYGTTGDGEVHVVDTNGVATARVEFRGEYRHLSGFGDGYALLTDTYVEKITANGSGGIASVEADGRQVRLDGELAVVLGLNRLTAHPFE